MLSEPFYQLFEYDCAVACLTWILKYYNRDYLSYPDFIIEVGANFFLGTSPSQIINSLRKYNFTIFESHNMNEHLLNFYTKQGRFIISPIQNCEAIGHWVIIMGFNKITKLVYLMDPTEGFVEISFKNFSETWHDVDHSGKEYRQYGIIIGTH